MPQTETLPSKQGPSAVPAQAGNEAPSQACWFTDCNDTVVTFAESTDAVKDNKFNIVGYSGGIIPRHWYWGNLAFDLKGLKFGKKKTPVLCQHDVDRRVGVATKQEITDQVTFEGAFLSNEDAQKVKSDMLGGFPMEASLNVPPTVTEFVEGGSSVEVNGLTLKGPGTVFRQATIKEVSICVFGADANTSASAFEKDSVVRFSRTEKESIMPDKNAFTLETLHKDYPDVHAAVFKAGQADGESKERALFVEILTACGTDYELATTCFRDGKTSTEATAMRLAKVEAENTRLKAEAAKQPVKPVDPAVQEFSDGEAAQQKRKADVLDVSQIDPDDEASVKAAYQASDKLRSEYFSWKSMQSAIRRARKAGE